MQGAICKSRRPTISFRILIAYGRSGVMLVDLCLCVKANPDAYRVKWELLPYIEPNPAAPAQIIRNGKH